MVHRYAKKLKAQCALPQLVEASDFGYDCDYNYGHDIYLRVKIQDGIVQVGRLHITQRESRQRLIVT